MNSVSDNEPDKEIGVSPDFLPIDENQGKPRSVQRLRGNTDPSKGFRVTPIRPKASG